jgi:DNA-binding response OmpR family regulator
MYNIGTLFFKEPTDNMFDQKDNIIMLEENVEDIDKLHAVMIREEETSDLSIICDLISKIKKKSDCYIWIVTATENSVGKLVYLQLGADAVFGANREVKEINLITKNALSRIIQKKIEGSSDEIPFGTRGTFELNPSNISLFLDGKKEIILTRLEYQIVEILLGTPNTAVSYETIYQKIWKDSSLENKQYRVANVVYHLRRKIEKNIKDPKYIKTVRSKGYMLSV